MSASVILSITRTSPCFPLRSPRHLYQKIKLFPERVKKWKEVCTSDNVKKCSVRRSTEKDPQIQPAAPSSAIIKSEDAESLLTKQSFDESLLEEGLLVPALLLTHISSTTSNTNLPLFHVSIITLISPHHN